MTRDILIVGNSTPVSVFPSIGKHDLETIITIQDAQKNTALRKVLFIIIERIDLNFIPVLKPPTRNKTSCPRNHRYLGCMRNQKHVPRRSLERVRRLPGRKR